MKNQGVETAIADIDNITQITQEVYDQLCDQYGGGKDLLCLEVVDEEGVEVHEFVFIPLSSTQLALANKLIVQEQDINGYNDTIVMACAINGRSILRDSDNLKRALYKHVDRLVTSCTATVKKRKRTREKS